MKTTAPLLVVRFAALAFAFVVGTTSVFGQTAAQPFVMTVPSGAAVTTPPATEMISSLDGTSQSFPPQIWSLASTSTTGLVATFEINQPFSHLSLPAAKLNASMSLRIAETVGTGVWTTPQANSATNHDSGDDSALVQVESNGNGVAQVELQVACENALDVPAGQYETTLTCTIAVP